MVPREVASVIEDWGFRCLVNRAGFAVFDHSYSWNRRFEKHPRARLWPVVRGEYRCMAAIGPLIYMENDLPFYHEAFCCDSCGEGFATCITDATREELIEVSQWAGQKGWFVAVHAALGPPEESDSEGEEERPIVEESCFPDPVKEKERLAWSSWDESETDACGTLELCAGSGAWTECVREQGKCRSISLDIQNGKHQDLSQGVLQAAIIQELKRGEHWAVLFSLPAGTFSAAASPAARSRTHPLGCPGLSQTLNDRLQSDESLFLFALTVGELCIELGILFFLEASRSTLYKEHPILKEFVAKQANALGSLLPVALDFCPFGGTMRRQTEVWTNAPWFRELAKICPGCSSHAGVRQVCAAERNGEYPYELARVWTERLLREGPSVDFQQAFPTRVLHGAAPNFDPDKPFRRPAKIRGPPLRATWGDPKRWKIAIVGTWARQGHINVLEARSALQAVRRLARNPKAWGKRVLGITDSQVVQGCYGKGRSSARALVSPCRRLAALQLGLRLRVRWRWISTTMNCSDGPSRGSKVPGVK